MLYKTAYQNPAPNQKNKLVLRDSLSGEIIIFLNVKLVQLPSSKRQKKREADIQV